MSETEAPAGGASLPVVVRERDRYVRRPPSGGQDVPRWPIPGREWLTRIYVPLSCAAVSSLDLTVMDRREWRVGFLLFLVLAGLGAGLSWNLANLLARVTVSYEELVLHLRYTLRARTIPRGEIRRLLRCTARGPGRYPLLIVVGEGDRTLGQLEVDHYADDDLMAIAGALGVRLEGGWEQMPSVTQLIALFPGFQRFNPSAKAALFWWIVVPALAAVLAWVLTPVILR
jgi:hypothetical protein